MNKNKTLFISSINGDVHLRESKYENINVWFDGRGEMSTDDNNVFIDSAGKYVEISLPKGMYTGLCFQNVNGNIEIDTPNTCFKNISLFAINGDINGQVKYHQLQTQDINGINNLNGNRNISRPSTIVKKNINQNDSSNDRTVSKEWKW